MARVLPWLLLLLGCASPGPAGPTSPAGRPSLGPPARLGPPAGSTGSGERPKPGAPGQPDRAAPDRSAPAGLGWGFGAEGLIAVQGAGNASRTLQTLDREHTVEVFSLPFDFGANERDAILAFRTERGERCSEAERTELRGRRAFYSRCKVEGGVEHAMALTTGHSLLLAVCKARAEQDDRCAAMLRTFWLPEPAAERFHVQLARAARVGARFTIKTHMQRTLALSRTGPDHVTRDESRSYQAELELVGEVLELDAESAPRRVRFTVEEADAEVDGKAVAIKRGTRVLLDRAARPQTRIESRGVASLAAEVLESALGAAAYFPLAQARYGTPQPQPLDGTWAGPAEVQAAGGEAYSKLIAVLDCDAGRCIEVETETFMPGLVSMAFVEGSGSEAARILLRGLYPLDPAAQVPWYALHLAQHSEGILTENRRAYMIQATTRVTVAARVTWHTGR